jgi:uncharacterized protein (TIGR03437 family)
MRHSLAGLAFLLVAAALAPAQTVNWRRAGNSAVDVLLASPATGPVDRVWFSSGGGTLYARTRSGRTFETSDYEVWMASPNAVEPAATPEPAATRLPETGAKLVSASYGKIYALGRQLHRSDDGGRSWSNLTAFKTDSVIGLGQRSIAVSPSIPDQIVAANEFGVWRSLDGGLSWTGLNEFLPNLRVRRILSTPAGVQGLRAEIDGFGAAELAPGASVWQTVEDAGYRADQVRLAYYAERAAVHATTFARADHVVYLGTAEGRILISDDDGATFKPTDTGRAAGPVERIFVDPARPNVAVAALGGAAAPHILHTFNSGGFWDALDSNLPNAAAHAVAAERSSGALYLATDQGVFWTQTDLDNAGSPNPNWLPLSDTLPAGMAATDVRLDPAGVQLYAAVDGYGVYAAAAPHRQRSLRLVNAADFSTRPAAPGSLVSVIGGRVSAARAGNLDYPVLAAADDASQIQVPFNAAGPNVSLALTTGAGNVRLGMTVLPVSPALFVGLDGSPILQDAETGLLLDARKGARAAARLLISATGLGRVTPDWPTGVPARTEDPPAVAAVIRAFVNGAPVPVLRATLAGGFIGFYVVEIQMPAINNAGPAELYITADGVESNRVQFLIEP